VRLITEPEQYRDASRMWHAWNVDRLYMGGVQIRQRAHQGLNHQKSVILYDQDSAGGDQPMVIFGSSNWTSPSASGQLEHNIFTTKVVHRVVVRQPVRAQVEQHGGILENVDFVPLPPDPPANPVPADGTGNVATSVRLTWNRRPVGAFVRRVSRYESESGDAHRRQPRRVVVEDADQHVSAIQSR
jgi:phosphatidylserine/phosphatidylglycerophosphate/cardiolipin synthase-like enzyme